MKYYNVYRGSKQKNLIIKRVLLVFAVCVCVFVITLLVGLSMKKKTAAAPSPSETVAIPETAEPGNAGVIDETRKKETVSVLSGYAVLSDFTGGKASAAAFNLVNSGYSGASFVLMRDSKLLYASPAAAQIAKMPLQSGVMSYDELKNAVSTSKSASLRTTAVIGASAVIANSDSGAAAAGEYFDAVLTAELYGIGFDEVIITGLFDSCEFTEENVERAAEYLDKLKSLSKISVGVCLQSSVFENSENAIQLENLYAKADFLSVDLTADQASSVNNALSAIPGSLSYFNLRVLASGTTAETVRAQITALSAKVGVNIQFVTQLAPPPAPVTTE